MMPLANSRIMARVLITGGAGYVGSHCAKALATVIALDVSGFASLL
jgi:nucleoside-diphosphate-sugar epimerase